MNLIKISSIASIVILIMIVIPIIHASELTQIKVILKGETVINLDETNRLMRATVEVLNYDAAGDGYFYMQLIQPGGKIISEEEIMISSRANQMWGTEIAGMLDDEKIMKGGKPVLGQYEIKVITERGTATGSAYFTIIKPSDPQGYIPPAEEEISPTLQDNNSTSITEIENEQDNNSTSITEIENEQDNNSTSITEIENEQEELLEDSELISNGEIEPKVPEWVRNIALWYGEGILSEDEFIDAIRFLIKEGVVIV